MLSTLGHRSSRDCLRHSNRLLLRGGSLQRFQLHEHILTIIPGLSHALIEVVEGRVRHLQCLIRYGSHTT